jgi:hypothetical protein
MWYWASIVSESYSRSVDSQLTSDFREIKEWFSNTELVPSTVRKAREIVTTLNLRDVKSTASALYNGVLCLLVLRGARDFDTGQSLDNASINERDHIFPKSQFRQEKFVNSILNITWNSDATNGKIKRYDKPSIYCKKFIEKYGGDAEEFQRILETHLITKNAYECMVKDDFGGFLEEREKAILREFAVRIGAPIEQIRSYSIQAGKSFENKDALYSAIRSCEKYIHWVDSYFTYDGIKDLQNALITHKVTDAKILTSLDSIPRISVSLFAAFRDYMAENAVKCEMRVMLKPDWHDRFLISANVCYLVPSPDTISRGKHSVITPIDKIPPFEDWWSRSVDITKKWDDLLAAWDDLQKRRKSGKH